jgi:hypothetical protein
MSTAKLVWHGNADQVVDFAKESIRDIEQLPSVPAPRGIRDAHARGLALREPVGFPDLWRLPYTPSTKAASTA